MRVGVARVAKPAIGDRERIVKARRLWLDLDRRRKVLDRGRVVATCERRTAGAIEGGGVTRRQGERLRERRFRSVGTPFDESHVTEPDERRHVIRIQRQHALKQRRGSFRIVPSPLNVRQEVRPARVVRFERLRVQKACLGRVEVLGREEQPSHVAVRERPFCRRRGDTGDFLLHRGVGLSQLLLDRWSGAGNIRKCRLPK
jgi:hypothetical protein